MLSVIISSYQTHYFRALINNIDDSCGVPYEIIQIQNPGIKGICQAYNEGMEESQYPYMLFLHEDVYFETIGWGQQLVETFEKDTTIGLIGLAGSKVKTRAPSAWYENGETNNVECVKQYDKGCLISDYAVANGDDKPEEVVTIDGVFIAMRKSTGLRFDERLTGFHNYDLAISACAKEEGWKIIVLKAIIMEHFSLGNFESDWLLSTHHFYQLYAKKMPLLGADSLYSKQLEKDNLLVFFHKCFIHQKWDIAYYYLDVVWKLYPFSKESIIMSLKWTWSKMKRTIRG